MDLKKITEVAYLVDRAFLMSVGDKEVPDWSKLTAAEQASFSDSVQGAMSQDVPIIEDKVEYSRACIMNALAKSLTGFTVPEKAEKDKTPLMYIGRRDEIKDSIYNTGIWKKGQTKGVADVLARKMAQLHPDVYAIGDKSAAEDAVEQKEDQAKEEEDNRDQDARDQVYSMSDLGSIKNFMERNFNQTLHHTIKKVDTARERAVELIDRFGMPE